MNKNIIYLKGNFILKTLEFYKFLKKNKITHLFNYLPLNNILGIIIGKIANVRGLYGGIMGVKHKKRIKMVFTKYLCNHLSTAFISNSFAASDSYIKYGLNKNKIKVIHNAIEEIELKKTAHTKVIILSVGRFTEEKDYFTAIKAVSYLLNKQPD